MFGKSSLSTLALCLAAALCGLAIILLVCASGVQRFVELAGVNIPAGDVLTDYTAGILWACLLGVSILIWPVSWRDKRMLVAAWIIKSLVCLVVMLPYEQSYSGLDCWYYFQRAHADMSVLAAGLLDGGANLVIAVGGVHLKLGPDSYHAMKLTFSMIGFVAVYLFYRSAQILIARQASIVFWGLTLYPTILFWSSILGKDPIILLGIAIHIWGLVNVAVRRKHSYLWAVLAGIVVASSVRIWMGPILLGPALLMLGVRIRHSGWRLAAITVMGLSLAGLCYATFDRLEFAQAADILDATRSISNGWDRANSSLKLDAELNSTADLLLFVPQGMFIAYFRPLPGDVPHVFGLLAGCENLILLLLSVWALFRLRRRDFRESFFIWGLTLLLFWGLAYSVIAYKDLGTAARFKLQIIPVMLSMIWFLIARPQERIS